MTLFQRLLTTVHCQKQDNKSINSRIFIDKPLKKTLANSQFFLQNNLWLKGIFLITGNSFNSDHYCYCTAITSAALRDMLLIALRKLRFSPSPQDPPGSRRRKRSYILLDVPPFKLHFLLALWQRRHCRHHHHQHLYQKAKKKIVRKRRLFRPIPTFI